MADSDRSSKEPALVIRRGECGGVVIERHRFVGDLEPEHVLYLSGRQRFEEFISVLQSTLDGLEQVDMPLDLPKGEG